MTADETSINKVQTMQKHVVDSLNKINKLSLTAGIDIIFASHHDIKRYEGEKESNDDRERER